MNRRIPPTELHARALPNQPPDDRRRPGRRSGGRASARSGAFAEPVAFSRGSGPCPGTPTVVAPAAGASRGDAPRTGDARPAGRGALRSHQGRRVRQRGAPPPQREGPPQLGGLRRPAVRRRAHPGRAARPVHRAAARRDHLPPRGGDRQRGLPARTGAAVGPEPQDGPHDRQGHVPERDRLRGARRVRGGEEHRAGGSAHLPHQRRQVHLLLPAEPALELQRVLRDAPPRRQDHRHERRVPRQERAGVLPAVLRLSDRAGPALDGHPAPALRAVLDPRLQPRRRLLLGDGAEPRPDVLRRLLQQVRVRVRARAALRPAHALARELPDLPAAAHRGRRLGARLQLDGGAAAARPRAGQPAGAGDEHRHVPGADRGQPGLRVAAHAAVLAVAATGVRAQQRAASRPTPPTPSFPRATRPCRSRSATCRC